MVSHDQISPLGLPEVRHGRKLLASALRPYGERCESAMMIKAPRVDEPRTRGVSGRMLADAYTFRLKSGTRVTVVYMGKEILIQVVDVIKPTGVFAGRVLEIDQAETSKNH
jgi:hypothetical protein